MPRSMGGGRESRRGQRGAGGAATGLSSAAIPGNTGVHLSDVPVLAGLSILDRMERAA